MSDSLRDQQRLRPRGSNLGRELAEKLRARIIDGEFQAGARLPSETAISDAYGVSRVTVRTAVKLLESQGLVNVRHGSGTYVADFGGQVRTGLQELRSITETIQEMGFTPRMERHRMEQRPASCEEAAKLGIAPDTEVISIQRAILGDEIVMAYSYDVIPSSLIPRSHVGELGVGSLFGVLDQLGLQPVRALAELHAVSSTDVAWGSSQPESGLYLLLDQVHQNRRGEAIAYSKTYFVEGRFTFMILRTR
jgi:GntR family transcriptional regulator